MTTEMYVADPAWGSVSGPYDVVTHKPSECATEHCTIHNPSEHPLKDAPMVLRLDKFALIERQCEHGVGHPDPDSVAWLNSQNIMGWGVHGCDGCCMKEVPADDNDPALD